jgi:ferric enterobactin receptor
MMNGRGFLKVKANFAVQTFKMKAFSLCLIFTLLFSGYSFAQNFGGGMWGQGPSVVGKVTGTVIDNKTKEPVEFATVSITKAGKIMNGTITDSKGNFKLENLSPGRYVVNVSFVGYEMKSMDSVSTTPEKPDLNLGKIYLSPSSIALKEFEVKADAAVFENKIDRLVYNAEKDVTSQGGDASDVLNKVPMVSVDQDGNVMLRGSSNVRILINGKPSGMMASNVGDAIKMIPANQIKSVEVITSPSAKYDAEGTSGIINIITKKNNLEGTTGGVNATAGNLRSDAGGNLAVKKGRLSVNTGINGNYSIPRVGTLDFFREDFTTENRRTLSQQGEFVSLRQGGSANASIDYDFNAYNNISASARYGMFGSMADNNVIVSLSDPLMSFQRLSENPNASKTLDWNVDYRKTYKNSKKEFSASLVYNNRIRNEEFFLEQSDLNNLYAFRERSFNTGGNNEWTAQVDYSHPVKTAILVETGAKSTFRMISSDIQYQVGSNGNLFIDDAVRSNKLLYGQNIFAGYSQASYKLNEKYEMKAGLRYELTQIDGSFNYGNMKVREDYQNFIPSFSIARSLKNFKSLKFNYSQRIQRPGLNFLNPFVNAADPRNVSFGNPFLAPELTHNSEITYGAFNKVVAFTASAYNRYTTNAIQNVFSVDSNGITLGTFENVGTTNANGVNVFGQLTIMKKLVWRGSVNANYTVSSGELNGESISNGGIQYNAYISGNYDFGKGLVAEAFLMYNAPRITLQGTVPSFSMTNFAVKKEIFQKKGSIGFTVTNPISGRFIFETNLNGETFRQRSTVAIPFRGFGITFNYRFGKLEAKKMPGGKRRKVTDDQKKDETPEF